MEGILYNGANDLACLCVKAVRASWRKARDVYIVTGLCSRASYARSPAKSGRATPTNIVGIPSFLHY